MHPKPQKISVRQRLKALELMAHPPIMEEARIEAIEKQIAELQDRYTVIEEELIKPLQRLRSESQSEED